VYASIFDVHVDDDDGNHRGDEHGSITRTPSLAMMEMGDRDGEHGRCERVTTTIATVIACCSVFLRGTFSIEGIGG
jgi:hypothetical protein